MKKAALPLVLGVVLSLLGVNLFHTEGSFFALAQPTCCNPPLKPPVEPRFPQGATVNVYIDASNANTSTGFTTAEKDRITEGVDDWNGEANNTGITWIVHYTTSLPAPGTDNTIIVKYNNASNPSPSSFIMQSSSGPNGLSIHGTMTFFATNRDPNHPASKPEQIRASARHEIGHGVGLDNADDCPVGSTIMNPSYATETFITSCDNNTLNGDPAYPAPTAAPTPEPTPPLCLGDNFTCFGSPECCSGWCNGNLNQCQDCPGQLYNGLCTETPILIDVLGNGFDLTSLEAGVTFDLNADGTAEHLSWTSTGSDDAWLALDRNNNVTIDDGMELFGEFAAQPVPPIGESKNGFLALAEFDRPQNGGDNDGEISASDAVFSSLRLWQDSNHNGVSESVELKTLVEVAIRTIELDYKTSKRTDEHGNRFRYRAKVKGEQDAQLGRWAWDVFLVTQ